MAGDKFAGINIKWDYANCRCRISMPGYIENLLIKFKHPHSIKPRLSPYKCLPISCGAKAQLTPEADASGLLDEHRKCHIQKIVGSLLYYAQAVDNKLLVALSAIAARQSYATVATEQAVHLLFDYVATYPADGIVYRSSDMILCFYRSVGPGLNPAFNLLRIQGIRYHLLASPRPWGLGSAPTAGAIEPYVSARMRGSA